MFPHPQLYDTTTSRPHHLFSNNLKVLKIYQSKSKLQFHIQSKHISPLPSRGVTVVWKPVVALRGKCLSSFSFFIFTHPCWWLQQCQVRGREVLNGKSQMSWASLLAQMVKNLPAMWETWVQSPDFGGSPGEGNGNPLQYSCLENPHGQRSLADYSPWGRKESDTTELFHFLPFPQA